jgi:hypothetical protein
LTFKAEIDFNKILDYNMDFTEVEGFNKSSGKSKVPAGKRGGKLPLKQKLRVTSAAETIRQTKEVLFTQHKVVSTHRTSLLKTLLKILVVLAGIIESSHLTEASRSYCLLTKD